MIRAEFVFMLGGEVDDEEVEAEQSVELQAGRLQNRGQRDLRAATIAMSQAEKLLTGANTAEALVAERAAVTALQRAFSRDRYILRALATRSQLDPARRLTGSLADADGWRRVAPDVPANRASGAAAGSAARDRGADRRVQKDPPTPKFGPRRPRDCSPKRRSVIRRAARSSARRSCCGRGRCGSIRPRQVAPDGDRVAARGGAADAGARSKALDRRRVGRGGLRSPALARRRAAAGARAPRRALGGAFADALRREPMTRASCASSRSRSRSPASSIRRSPCPAHRARASPWSRSRRRRALPPSAIASSAISPASYELVPARDVGRRRGDRDRRSAIRTNSLPDVADRRDGHHPRVAVVAGVRIVRVDAPREVPAGNGDSPRRRARGIAGCRPDDRRGGGMSRGSRSAARRIAGRETGSAGARASTPFRSASRRTSSGPAEAGHYRDRRHYRDRWTTTGTAATEASVASGFSRTAADVVVDARTAPFRVEFYEPRPSWSTTFLRRALEADARFEVASLSFASRGVSGRRRDRRGAAGRCAPRRVRRRDRRRSRSLTAADARALERFMRERGGAVVVVPDQRIERRPRARSCSAAPDLVERLLEAAGDACGRRRRRRRSQASELLVAAHADARRRRDRACSRRGPLARDRVDAARRRALAALGRDGRVALPRGRSTARSIASGSRRSPASRRRCRRRSRSTSIPPLLRPGELGRRRRPRALARRDSRQRVARRRSADSPACPSRKPAAIADGSRAKRAAGRSTVEVRASRRVPKGRPRSGAGLQTASRTILVQPGRPACPVDGDAVARRCLPRRIEASTSRPIASPSSSASCAPRWRHRARPSFVTRCVPPGGSSRSPRVSRRNGGCGDERAFAEVIWLSYASEPQEVPSDAERRRAGRRRCRAGPTRARSIPRASRRRPCAIRNTASGRPPRSARRSAWAARTPTSASRATARRTSPSATARSCAPAAAGSGRGGDATETYGFGVRVIHGGVWGFASSPLVTPEEIKRVTGVATDVARASAVAKKRDVQLAPVQAYDEFWQVPIKKDPVGGAARGEDRACSAASPRRCRRTRRCCSRSRRSASSTSGSTSRPAKGSFIEQVFHFTNCNLDATARTGSQVKTRSYERLAGSRLRVPRAGRPAGQRRARRRRSGRALDGQAGRPGAQGSRPDAVAPRR